MQKWLNPSGTGTYFAWRNMRSRCYNSNDIGFANYGGRGISVCDAWRDNYDAFVSDMGLRPQGLTLERIDTNGNYEPGNCRWATRVEQGRNRRTNTLIAFQGQEMPLSAWAERLEISPETLLDRLGKMPLDRAMTKGLLVNWAPGKHGTVSTYSHKKCRCEKCVMAARKYKRDAYHKAKANAKR